MLAEFIMPDQEKTLMKQFEDQTGKHAVWRGKKTKGYQDWKDKLDKKTSKILTKQVLKSKNSTELNLLISKFTKMEARLEILENAVFGNIKKKQRKKISEGHILRIIKTIYKSNERKMGNFILISDLTEKIKDYLPWSTEQIHEQIYKLFMEYKVDIQPGKQKSGQSLKRDGKIFVWFALKNNS
ncbi:hypothetical protein LCGC14_1393560 [marine sediment metagenome]|uniref:Uncharacterized protein n=1 Tax=marine sediment metagenome TaxID=412755 RepID=A0A0F9JZ74_9ZZZZ